MSKDGMKVKAIYPRFIHYYGVPLIHAFLWILGLKSIFTCFAGNLLSYDTANLLGVFTVFMIELAVTFVDLTMSKEIKKLKLSIFMFFAIIVLIFALTTVSFVFYTTQRCNWSLVCILLCSATLKFCEVYLQNNLERFKADDIIVGIYDEVVYEKK